MRWFRSNMFRELTGNRYARRLIATKGDDDSVLEDEITKILRVERFKRRLRQYFPRLVVNVFFNRIVKPEKKPSKTTEKFAEQSLEARRPTFEIVEAERPDGT